MRIPVRSLATLVFAVGVATCADAPSVGPRPANAPGKGRFALAPVFSRSAAAVFAQRALFADVNFDHVRIVLVRPPSDTVKDTTIVFTPGTPAVTLDLTVEVRSIGESFTGVVDYTNNGAVVFHGEATLQSHAIDEPAPPAQEIVVQYVGIGSNATRLAITPKTLTLEAPKTAAFSATVFDAAGNPVAGVPLSWSSSDPTVATINASTGALATTGKRGTTTVTARTPTSLTDNASVTVTLPATGLTLVSGGGQTGKAGAALALPGVVRAVASDGVGVAGVAVTFAAPSGGSVGSASVTTDANGQASTSLTLGGTAGPQSFAAASGSLSVSIPATATPADASSILAVSGGGQSDTVRRALKQPFVAKVTDRFGNANAGVTVTWARTAGAGTVGSATSVTSADGFASTGYTLGATVGTEAVTATASGVTGSATFSATALASAPAAIAAVSGSGQTGRVTQALGAPFVVRVTDDQGNPVSGVSVAWTATNGTLSASTTTDAQGQSSNTMTLGSAVGPASATATIAGKSVSFTATVQPGVVAQLVFRSAPPSGTTGAALTPPVQLELRDAGGNLTAAANPVSIALGANPGGATLAGTLTRTSAAGVATFDDLTLDRVGTGYTLVATSGGTTPVTSAAFNITATPGSAPTITIVAGDNQTTVVNTAVSVAPSVRVADANNNPVAGIAVTFAPGSGSGAVVPATSIATNAQGVATLTSWTLGTTAGAQTLVASAPNVTGVTFHATAQGGAAAKLGITTQPSATATSGSPLATQPVIQIQDQFGNAVPAGTIVVTATPSSGSATGNTVTANPTTGVATFINLALTASGNVTVTFSATGLQPVTSNAIAVSPSGPGGLQIVAGNNQSAVVNGTVAVAPSVRVVDVAGAPVAGVAVTFTPATGSGTVAPTTAIVTNFQGIATLTSWTLGTAAGSQSLVASSAGLTSVTFNATAGAGAASKLAITIQPSATATSGVALTQQPALQVQDQFNNPVGAGTLQVTATASAGTASGNTIGADPTTGTATFTTLTLNGSGSVTITFSANQLTPVVSNPITVTPAGPTRTWTGVVSTDWNVAGNWSAGGVPIAANSVSIPAGTPNDPTLTSAVTVTDVTVATGARIVTGTFVLTASGNVDAGSTGITGAGPLTLTGTGTTVRGTLFNVVVAGNVSINAATSIPGTLTVVSGGNLSIASVNVPVGAVSVQGHLTVGAGAAIAATSLSVTTSTGLFTQTGGSLSVLGAATFAGASTVGQVTAGALVLAGNFTQTSGVSTQSFAASGSHVVIMNGSAARTVSFANAGPSHFQDWSIDGPGTLTLATPVVATGLLVSSTGASPVAGGGNSITSAGLSVDGLSLDNALLVSTGGTISRFDNVTFQNYAATATPLTISHPGASAPFVFNGTQFLVTPTSGAYLNVTDTSPTDGQVLSIQLTGSTPADGSSQTATAGGAIVTWGSGGVANSWSNLSGGSWSNPANWSLARVPISTDSVVIALGGTYTVILDTTFTGTSITVGGTSGVQTLSITSRTLTLANALRVRANGVFSPVASVVTGAGTVINQGTINLSNSTIATSSSNQALLRAVGSSAITGPLTTVAASMLRLEGNGTTGNSFLTVANGFTNNGAIELTSIGSSFSETLALTNGTLTNANGGTITTIAGTGGTRTLNAELNNQGLVTLNHPLTMSRASAAHVNSGTIDLTAADLNLSQSGSFSNSGTVTIGAGRTWTITGGTLNQSAGTVGGPGTLSLTSTIANFTTNFTNATTLLAVTSSTVNGPGTITNAVGRTLTLQSSTIGASSALINQGTTIATGTSAINGALTATAGSILRLQGNGSVGNSFLTIANGFTNDGAIELTSIGSGFSETLTITNGTLTNASGATITTLAGTGGQRTITAELNNQGTVTVGQATTINRPSAQHINASTLNVNADLTITQSGTSPTFTNSGTASVATGQTWTVSGGTFTQSGTVNGAGELALTSLTAAFNNGFTLGALTLTSTTANFQNSFSTGAVVFTTTGSTINGPGTITNASGQTLNLQSSTIAATSALINQGTVIATGTSPINGALTAAAGSILRLQGNGSVGNSFLTIANGFTNNGAIELTSIGSGFSETLTITNGTLTNASGATITTLAGTGGQRTITAELNNQGTVTVGQATTINRPSAQHINASTLNVNADLTITQSGTSPTFTNSGTASIATGQTWTVSGGTFMQSGTVNGAGELALTSLTAAFNNGFTLGALTLTSTTANFQNSFSTGAVVFTTTGSTINGPGTITNASGQTLNLQSSTIAATSALINQGTVIATGTSAVNGALTAAAGSILRLQGNGSVGNSFLTIANGFTNNGAIELTSIGSGFSETLTITNGTLTNATGGTITTLAGTGGQRTITAELNNQGTVTLGQATTINGSSAQHTNSGTVSVSGGNLTLTQSGTGPTFVNTVTGFVTIGAARTLTISGGTFTHQVGGTLNGGGALALSGVAATFNTGFTLSALTLTGSTVNFQSNVTTASLALSASTSTITGPGTLTNVAGQTMTLLGGSAVGSSAFINGGTLMANGANTISAPFTTAVGSILRLEGNGSVGNSALTVSSPNGFTNNGTIDLTSIGSGFSATLAVTNGGLFNASGGAINSLSGAGGTRTITAAVNNQGVITVAPGAGQILTVSGNLTSTGTINLELGGTTVGTQYDRLAVGGSATLGGTINVGLINGFVPATGSQFDILSFASLINDTATYVLPGGPTAWTKSNPGTVIRITKT